MLILIAILGVTVTTRALPSDTFQLQASRDRLVTAFFAAQQRAMAQTDPVRLTISAPNQIDIRQDTDGDGDFADESSLRVGGTSYPVILLANQSLSASVFDFDRLGHTTPATLTLTQSGKTINIGVSATGFIF